MLLSRREVLVGTAATASMIGLPASVALAASQDEWGRLPALPASPPEYILDPASLSCPPHVFFTLYRNDFGDGRLRYDSNSMPRNRLAWAFESTTYLHSPFSLLDAWKLFDAAGGNAGGRDNHAMHLAGLMSDKRDKFFVPVDIANDLGGGPAHHLFFEKSPDWISFSSYHAANCWVDSEPAGTFRMKRRAG